ncbi:F0F1 ATP synthase subunit B [Hoeflea ulvae]|uniref:ATP synthase subunit b n=1 Tax=Hoeflea ulvae TaxID=2983764 RepID=A0ABT3YLK2_9HYPH|nr:F0F1 ATP synthase subunit B [Hoeflea ulvae]MCY0096774.1 F0F1 ATP synthase subunit B [Hoeflea ulvae]
MSIDWITVAAQIGNFLVLVWLLKRFFYRPILDGIDAREAEIADRMQAAVVAKQKAEAGEAEYHEKIRALNVAQSEMAETIRKKAEEQRDALLAEARERMDREYQSWTAHLDEEARKFTTGMHQAGARALLAVLRKALTDLADQELEGQMAHRLAQQLSSTVADLHHTAGHPVSAVVTSHDTLPPAAQEDMSAELRKVFPGITVRFETDEQQSPGLILRIGGAELAWTVESYVDGLDAVIGEQLSKASEAEVRRHDR